MQKGMLKGYRAMLRDFFRIMNGSDDHKAQTQELPTPNTQRAAVEYKLVGQYRKVTTGTAEFRMRCFLWAL